MDGEGKDEEKDLLDENFECREVKRVHISGNQDCEIEYNYPKNVTRGDKRMG